jgi:DNA polymerase-3 subunit epsilon
MLGWLIKKSPLYEQVKQFNAVALPALTTPARQCNYLAIDLEMTGLHARQDHIVSIGWVPIVKQQIELNQAKHFLIKPPVSVGQSAVYHGVHDKDLKNASELSDVLQQLLTDYPGYLFLAHHCRLDRAFLQLALQRQYGKAPRMQFIDTLNIEWHRMQKQGTVMKKDALRLPQCLQRYNLPVSTQHHALEDAYSCALLYLTQLKKSHPDITLGDILQQSS